MTHNSRDLSNNTSSDVDLNFLREVVFYRAVMYEPTTGTLWRQVATLERNLVSLEMLIFWA